MASTPRISKEDQVKLVQFFDEITEDLEKLIDDPANREQVRLFIARGSPPDDEGHSNLMANFVSGDTAFIASIFHALIVSVVDRQLLPEPIVIDFLREIVLDLIADGNVRPVLYKVFKQLALDPEVMSAMQLDLPNEPVVRTDLN